MDNNDNFLTYDHSFNRGNDTNKTVKKKLCFNDCKKNAINSLHEVEFFLNNIDTAFKCFNVWKFFKH